MSRIGYLIVVLGALLVCTGCGDDGKKSDPKPADPSKVDPRLKPAGGSSGGQPQQNKTSGAVKGD